MGYTKLFVEVLHINHFVFENLQNYTIFHGNIVLHELNILAINCRRKQIHGTNFSNLNQHWRLLPT
jgi:hypothetical protein